MNINPSSYADLILLRDSLDKQHSDLINRMNTIQEQLSAINLVLALLCGGEMPLSYDLKMREGQASIQTSTPVQSQLPPSITPFSDLLKGKTQLEALKMIARNDGGRLQVSEARRLMLRAGLIKTPKNAANIIFNVIKKSEQFRRVVPGVYELIVNPHQTAETIDRALQQISEKFSHKSA